MEKRVKKVDFWVLTIHIIRNTFSLVETGYKSIFKFRKIETGRGNRSDTVRHPYQEGR